MTRLDKSRLALLGHPYVAAVEAIYGCAAAPARWPEALHAIAGCFGDVGANLAYRRDDGAFGAVVSPGLLPLQKEYNEVWCHHDILGIRSWDAGYRFETAITTGQFVTARELETHPYYTQFFTPHGLRWSAGMEISPDPRFRVSLALHRAITKPPYADDELAVLTQLARHAEQSLRLGIRLLDAELATLNLGDALARLGMGVFLLDAAGRVEYMNPFGQRLIGDGLATVDGRLAPSAVEDHAAYRSAIDAVLSAGPDEIVDDPRPILVRRRTFDRPLTLYVLPVRVPAEKIAEQFLARTRALVLAIDPQADETADPALVRDLLGVTLGEARVAALVGSGVSPRNAAQKLGIAEETARNVLKRVFMKTGVSRQSELAALLTKLVLR